jgi:cytosine/adenosine deaminase-related metal-dependent hydrolase
VDITGTAFLSPGSVAANLVYAAHSDVITDVMIEGKWVMRGRQIPGEAEIMDGARSVLKQITL